MIHLKGKYFVEVKDKRYSTHTLYDIILGKREPSKILRTQYQVISETKVRRTQKVIKHDILQLEVKRYPKKTLPITEKPKIDLPFYLSCKQKNWVEFSHAYFCQNCDFINNN